MTIAVIFDLNGVLVDDIPYHKQAWIELSAKLGHPMTERDFEVKFNGRRNEEILRMLVGDTLSLEESNRLAEEKEAVYRKRYAPHIVAAPGALSLLRELKERGIPVGIATGAPRVNVDFVFEHLPLQEYIQTVVYAEEVKEGKPHPEVYLKAASRLGVSPEICVVFEDALLGIQAARSAGMKVVGVTTTHDASELIGAQCTVADFQRLSVMSLMSL
jgi:beta-phosphoglucomutase